MEKDDLTPAVNAALESARLVPDVLRVDIGSACRKYPDRDAFLRGTISFLDQIIEEPEKYLESCYYSDSIPPTSSSPMSANRASSSYKSWHQIVPIR